MTYIGNFHEDALEVGRNGAYHIQGIQLTASGDMVVIDGVSRTKGITLRGGFLIGKDDLDRVCQKWQEYRAGESSEKGAKP